MWPYWVMFIVPAAAALKVATSSDLGSNAPKWSPGFVAVAIALAFLVGYRDQVGGDWGTYMRHFEIEGELLTDPGYKLLNKLIADFGGDIHEVNLVCGTIFSFCLLRFCRDLPRPWLALSVAVPYLIIVVGMGYTRQAVALAIGMLGLTFLRRGELTWFFIFILVGATFHKTAVLLLPIAALSRSTSRFLALVWVFVICGLAYQVLLSDQAEDLYSAYVDAAYQSEGAFVRALMNAVPSAVLLIWRKRFRLGPLAALWTWLSLISIALPFVLLVTNASTAVDRMALYMLPLQLVVFSHVPDVLGQKRRSERLYWVMLILLYYLLVQFVWLNYAVNANYWLPYRFYPLEIVL